MKTLTLLQGTPAWETHRANHFNASDAPAMLGMSPYKSRAQLVREIATGVAGEIDEATQRRFDDGHRYEALARPLAEEIIGEELFPCVGVEGRFSASFDGLTMLEDTAFEHKSLNDDIRAAVDASIGNAIALPEHYRVQMEQQCMVSGAERVLFMASKWSADGNLVEERHCWYTPDQELRARIVAGWAQFEADVAAYQPEAASAPAAVGHAPDQLPALRIELTGMVTESNLAVWKDAAIAVFQGIGTDLQTDQDFADAERTVKWCGDIEEQLAAAKRHALSQTASIDELFRTIDAISEQARAKRLQLDKLVKQRKESIRGEIVTAGGAAVRAHYDAINATLGQYRIDPPQSMTLDIGAAIKGKKSIASMRDAVDAAAATAKVAASQRAERIRANVAILDQHAEHRHLFADAVQMAHNKAPDDLVNLIASRVREHREREETRLEQERERIRQEEVGRLERERRDEDARIERERQSEAATNTPKDPAPVAAVSAIVQPSAAQPAAPVATDRPGARIKLGDINAAIAPLSIDASGLAMLGFDPVASRGAAKLYSGSDFPAIVAALSKVVTQAPARLATLPVAA